MKIQLTSFCSLRTTYKLLKKQKPFAVNPCINKFLAFAWKKVSKNKQTPKGFKVRGKWQQLK